jgi:hypothetical protein
MKRPYRLDARGLLTAEPPFTRDLVREMIAAAMPGPKGRTAGISEPRSEEIKCLAMVLNSRHQFYYCAQQERSRKERRDRAAKLIGELRDILPKIVRDAEDQSQRLKGDFFSANTERAAKKVCGLIASDTVTTALPPVELPDTVRGWQWAAPSLYADVEQIIGANAAGRFIVATIPLLTGEKPKLSAVATWLKKRN